MARRARKIAATLIALCLLFGCRQMQANARLAEYESQLNPLIGKADKAQVIRLIGIPDRCEQAGKREFCLFFTSYCARAHATTVGVNTYASSVAVYDRVDVQFDESGKMVEWRAYVQR